MRNTLSQIVLALSICLQFCLYVQGQGTFVYDQQSAVEGALQDGGGFIQTLQPFGQSFTPTSSSVGFVRFWLYDANPNNGLGASVYVNLRGDSITGPIIDSTASIFLPDKFGDNGSNGYVNFFFTTPVTVTPGVTYYFQPMVQSGGDLWIAAGSISYNYPGGSSYAHGVANAQDLWFREGIVVPEPSAVSLLIGSGVWFYVHRKKNPKRSVR